MPAALVGAAEVAQRQRWRPGRKTASRRRPLPCHIKPAGGRWRWPIRLAVCLSVFVCVSACQRRLSGPSEPADRPPADSGPTSCNRGGGAASGGVDTQAGSHGMVLFNYLRTGGSVNASWTSADGEN